MSQLEETIQILQGTSVPATNPEPILNNNQNVAKNTSPMVTSATEVPTKVVPTVPPAVPSSSASGSSQASYELLASDFLKEFEDNAVIAQSRYVGKELTLEGIVETIDFDWDDRPYISVTGGGVFELNSVHCMVSDVSQTEGLSQGSSVTVVGTFASWDVFTATVESCTVR